MDWKNLAAAVLTPLLAALLSAFFKLIGYEPDPATVAAIVTAIVAWLLSLVFVNSGENAVRAFRARG